MVWAEAGQPFEATIEDICIHGIPRRHWPIAERWWPDARNERGRLQMARRLDRRHRFDWIEIQSDEGVDRRIQTAFRGRTILRVATSLRQMCEYNRTEANRLTRHWLERERESLALADKIVVHSHSHANELKRLFPGIVEPRIVPHGLGEATSNPDPAPITGVPKFLVVGTLDLRKGTDRLASVVAEYARRFGPCELRIVSPSTANQLADRFRIAAGNDLSIKMLGRISVTDLAAEYRGATALLHLARYESFGYPLVEAAAAAIPVVATRTGVASDLLVGECEGLLVDGDDPADCARGLHLATMQRAALGRRLFNAYVSNFSRSRMTERFLEVLAGWSSLVLP